MSFFSRLRKDIRVVFERDPAARSVIEVLFCYSGLHAIWFHRISHALYKRGWVLIPRMISNFARFLTGIEIHPGATIGEGLFIDHGTGIVIGETAEIGNNVTLYQGVTLGGTGKEKGKRHPTIGNNVVVASGAKVLGSFTVGDHAKIGAGSVVLKPVPPYATVVGIPGRIVVMGGKRVHTAEELRQALRATRLVESDDSLTDIEDELDVDLDHDMLPDPDEEMRECMMRQIQALEKKVNELEKRLEDKEHAESLQDDDPPQGGVQAAQEGRGQHLLLRRHAVQPSAHRQCAPLRDLGRHPPLLRQEGLQGPLHPEFHGC